MNAPRGIDRSRREMLAAMLVAPLAGCAAEVGESDESIESAEQALTKQESMDRFYAMDNIVTIKITMPAAKWEELRNAEPVGGRCNFEQTGDRYPQFEATSVEVSGTKFPASPMTFTRVGIKKKSFCGSFSMSRPSLKLDFAEFVSSNQTAIENLIGTRHLTLNNNRQDASCIRQALGYKLFQLAGLPFSRCNFVKVFVNGALIGQMYSNVEPIKERYLERNFGHLNGNLYELEADDFRADRIPFIEVEKPSKISNKRDLTFVASHLASNGLSGMAQVFDMTQFLKLYAMEFLLKHWDGYTTNLNNTYVYNDVNAVTNPGVGTIKFKFIPWGIDQILQPDRRFVVSDLSILGDLVRDDDARLTQLTDQIRTYRQTVFDRTTQAEVLTPFIDQMEEILTDADVTNVSAEIAIVRQQLKLVKSAAYIFAGLPSTSNVYVLEKDTGRCIHASDTEHIGSSTTDFEVVHTERDSSSSNRWFFTPSGNGRRMRNEKYGRWLHCSNTFVTSAGHLMVYTTPNEDSFHAKEFIIEPHDILGRFEISGYIRLHNLRNFNYLKFGTDDPTPGTGRQRVHQSTDEDASALFIY